MKNKMNEYLVYCYCCTTLRAYHRFHRGLVTLIHGPLTTGGLTDHRLTHQALLLVCV